MDKDTLRQEITNSIYTNTGGLVTGDVLQQVLLDMVEAIPEVSNITGFVSVSSIGDLPSTGVPTLGYLVGQNLYVYVGTGGDTLSGKYKNCGPFQGPQGNSGYTGAAGELEVVNNLTEGGTTAALSAEQGKVLKGLLDEGFLYCGKAVLTPTPTSPGTPAGKVAYMATEPGTYTNFDGLVVADGEVAVFKWAGSWSKETTGIATRAELRPYAAMAASPYGGFLDLGMVFSSTLLEYVRSNLYDSAWVAVQDGATKISVSGATPYKFRFFTSLTEVNSDTNLGAYDTGDIPAGARLCLIAFAHASNPDGYDQLSISQNGLIGMMDEFFPRGLYLARNKVLNITGSGASMKFQTNANFDCFVVFVQGASKITISGLLSTANYRFFNSAEIFDGSEIVSHYISRNSTGDVPVGAVVCIVSMRKTDYPNGHDSSVLERVYGAERKTIRILLIGNSATDDALSYVPFIMQNMGIPVNFQIGIAMMSSSTLAMHLSNWENETDAYQFRLYNGGAAWQDFADKSLQWMFDNYTWDIVSLQQAQPQKINTYQPYLNKLINAISAYVHNAVKFIWYQTHIYSALSNGGAPRGDQTIGEYYADEVTACQNIVGASACEYVVPVSTAIQNARSIAAIKALGDYAQNENNDTGNGWLNYLDGVHLQEGLPCQIAAYTFVLAFLEIFGFEEFSINGESTRVTSAWTSGKNIPSPHGSPIGSTDANCLIAQKCAIMAHKHPFEVTDMNNIVSPA